MTTVKELMIDDVVRDIKNKTTIRVAKIDKIAIRDADEEIFFSDEIEPIILTKDILEANNFKRIIMENYTDSSCFRVLGECFCYDIKGLGIDIRTSYERVGVRGGFSHILVRNKKNYACVENLDYVQVHQLQHALRLCGLNDIADNFKIE